MYRFCEDLTELMQEYETQSIVYFTTGNKRQITNCALLLASFLVGSRAHT